MEAIDETGEIKIAPRGTVTHIAYTITMPWAMLERFIIMFVKKFCGHISCHGTKAEIKIHLVDYLGGGGTMWQSRIFKNKEKASLIVKLPISEEYGGKLESMVEKLNKEE